MKKGVYFTLDALFATILIGFGLVLITQTFISDVTHPQLEYYSRDIAMSLSTIRIKEINDPFIQSLITSGEIENPNSTVIEQIGEFYVLNKTEYAQNLSEIFVTSLVPKKFGVQILVNDESIYLTGKSNTDYSDLVSSKRMVSGMEKFKPIKGATSKVFLENIRNKIFSSYLYYGGFIGQGNITHNISDLPGDADILSVELELDVAGDFDFYINDILCDSFSPQSNITVAERWNISGCKSSLNPGEGNKIDIKFDDLLNESFVSGGFLRVDYLTQELTTYKENESIDYYFPGVTGIANVYDAFYVPGTINSMNIYLHFRTNETSYITLGGKVIHRWDGSEIEQIYNLTNENLSDIDYADLASDYPQFSNNTVPLRFASYEIITKVITGGNADVVLITDLSGSMKKAVDSWGNGNSGPTCENFQDNKDTRRTRAAVCLDREFAGIVMNYSGNRMWPIFMRNDEMINYPWDPALKEDVIDFINNYYNDQGLGKTCLACTLNMAYDILNQSSNQSRKKFVVFMTDGVATHCADGSCQSNSTEFGTEQCDGMCDFAGSCGPTVLDDECDECILNDGASENALYSAQRIVDDLNATIYTIGFGPIEDCSLANNTLNEIAAIGNGSYQHSSDTALLQEIYRNISYEILDQIEQYTQSVSARGNLSEAILYPDSYIKVNYEPIYEQPDFEEIAISIEEDKFDSCNPSFDVPNGMRVIDAKVTSYSGHHWTSYLSINNKQVYNISDYLLSYVKLGDPFFVYVPVNNIVNGTNTLKIETADSPTNKTGCSTNNTIIYTGLVRSSISYADVKPRSEGCKWTIDFEDGSSSTLNVPEYYSGTKTCFYQSGPVFDYDVNDSIDSAAFQLFDNLDYDDDGEIFVNIDQYDLTVNAISVQKIPYPWGPAIAEVRVWK